MSIENRQVAVDVSKSLTAKEGAIKALLPAHINPDRYIKSAMAAIAKNPNILKCTKESIIASVIQAAQLGLEVGSSLGEGYLVPFKTECQFIPGYRGLISLARRSGEIVSITAGVVHEADEFEYELGLHPKCRHVPNLLVDDPGKIIAVYACAILRESGEQMALMPLREIKAIQKRSRAAGFGPWVTDFEEMAKKTGIRRLYKMLPVSTEALSRALEIQAQAEKGFSDDDLAELSDTDKDLQSLNLLASEAASTRTEGAVDG